MKQVYESDTSYGKRWIYHMCGIDHINEEDPGFIADKVLHDINYHRPGPWELAFRYMLKLPDTDSITKRWDYFRNLSAVYLHQMGDIVQNIHLKRSSTVPKITRMENFHANVIVHAIAVEDYIAKNLKERIDKMLANKDKTNATQRAVKIYKILAKKHETNAMLYARDLSLYLQEVWPNACDFCFDCA